MGSVHEKFLAARQSLSGQDWGFASAVDDVRHKVVEEGYFEAPDGQAVTGDIEPLKHTRLNELYGTEPVQQGNEAALEQAKHTAHGAHLANEVAEHETHEKEQDGMDI